MSVIRLVQSKRRLWWSMAAMIGLTLGFTQSARADDETKQRIVDLLPVPENVDTMFLLAPGVDVVTNGKLSRGPSAASRRYEARCMGVLRELLSEFAPDAPKVIEGRDIGKVTLIAREGVLGDPPAEEHSVCAALRINVAAALSSKAEIETQLERLGARRHEVHGIALLQAESKKGRVSACVIGIDASHLQLAMSNSEQLLLDLRHRADKRMQEPADDQWHINALSMEKGVNGSIVSVRKAGHKIGVEHSVAVISWIDGDGSFRQRWVDTKGTNAFRHYVTTPGDDKLANEDVLRLTGGPAGIRSEGRLIDENRVDLEHFPRNRREDVDLVFINFLAEAGIYRAP